jgi:hypothetical protein
MLLLLLLVLLLLLLKKKLTEQLWVALLEIQQKLDLRGQQTTQAKPLLRRKPDARLRKAETAKGRWLLNTKALLLEQANTRARGQLQTHASLGGSGLGCGSGSLVLRQLLGNCD